MSCAPSPLSLHSSAGCSRFFAPSNHCQLLRSAQMKSVRCQASSASHRVILCTSSAIVKYSLFSPHLTVLSSPSLSHSKSGCLLRLVPTPLALTDASFRICPPCRTPASREKLALPRSCHEIDAALAEQPCVPRLEIFSKEARNFEL